MRTARLMRRAAADCDWWVAVHEGPANATPQTPAIAVGPVRFVDARP